MPTWYCVHHPVRKATVVAVSTCYPLCDECGQKAGVRWAVAILRGGVVKARRLEDDAGVPGIAPGDQWVRVSDLPPRRTEASRRRLPRPD